MTKQQMEDIYDRAPCELVKKEKPDGGLLLSGCPHCGAFQTRDTYLSFWDEKVTLERGYSCAGIAKCKCGKWVKWVH